MRNTTTGQFERTTFAEKYPNGRKHCSDCKCWRLILDFTVHTWTDLAKSTPHKLLSYCRRCEARRATRRRERNRINRRGKGEFNARAFVRYLKPVLMRDDNAVYINGKRLLPSETRALHRWRTGAVKTVRIGTADSWAIRFDLPFWELEGIGKMAP